MKYWLLKTEPSTYSWDDLTRQKSGVWDGVRNAEARNNMKLMKAGDLLLIYHTGNEKSIRGIAIVTTEAFPEPDESSPWVAVGLKPLMPLSIPVSLTEVKSDPTLADMSLIRMSRLSVQPVSQQEFNQLMVISHTKWKAG